MKQEIKAKWLQALRSGEYRQGRYTLRTSNNSFCCLGVLCDLYNKEDRGFWKWEYCNNGAYSLVDKNGNDFEETQLPWSVMEWAGLNEHNPSVNVARSDDSASSLYDKEGCFEATTLIVLNDAGETFNRIADIIEDQL